MNTDYKHSSSENFLNQLPESLTEAKCFIEDKLNKLHNRKNELLASNSISSTHRHLFELKRLLRKLDLKKEFSELFPKDYDLYDGHRYSDYVTKLNQWKVLERDRFKDDLLDVVNHITLYQLLYHAKHYTGKSDQVVSSLLNTLDSLYAVIDKQHRLLNGFEKRIEAVNSEHKNLIDRLDQFNRNIEAVNSEHKNILERLNGFEKSIKSVNAPFAKLTKRIDGFEESIESINTELAKLTKRLGGFENSIESINSKLTNLTNRVEERVKSIYSKLNSIDSEFANLTDRFNGFEKSLEAVQSEQGKLIVLFKGVENKVGEVENLVNSGLANLTTLISKVDKRVKTINTNLISQFEGLQNRVGIVENNIKSVKEEQNKTQQQIDEFEKQVNLALSEKHNKMTGWLNKFDNLESKIRKDVTFIEKFSSYLESYKQKKEAFTYLLFVVIIGLLITVFYSGRYSIEYSLNELEERIAKLDEKTAILVLSKPSDKPPVVVSKPSNEPPVVSKPPNEPPVVSKPPNEPPVVSKPPNEPPVVSKPQPSIEDIMAKMESLEKRLEEEEKYQDEIIEHTIKKLGELEEQQQIEY